MIPVAILGFLIGAVFAWGFRVWILIPTTLLVFFSKMIFEQIDGTNFLTAVGVSFLLGMAPQLGYAFGLLARNGLVMLRSPHDSSLAFLSKHRSVNGV
jgi:hypothetical protein